MMSEFLFLATVEDLKSPPPFPPFSLCAKGTLPFFSWPACSMIPLFSCKASFEIRPFSFSPMMDAHFLECLRNGVRSNKKGLAFFPFSHAPPRKMEGYPSCCESGTDSLISYRRGVEIPITPFPFRILLSSSCVFPLPFANGVPLFLVLDADGKLFRLSPSPLARAPLLPPLFYAESLQSPSLGITPSLFFLPWQKKNPAASPPPFSRKTRLPYLRYGSTCR